MVKSKLIVSVLPLLLLVAILLIFNNNSTTGRNPISVLLKDKHRGVCWVAGPNEILGSEFTRLIENGVNWISQTPFGWQRGFDNPEIGTNKDIEANGYQAWWGERDEGLRITTQLAKENGIKVILKPHIWLRDSEGKWRGEIKMGSEEDWDKWFEEYSDFILHYAKLAEEEGIEMFCIGTELHQTCVERDEDWRELIRKIRSVYSGLLTYAANFSDEYQDILFWDELDYIGIQAYFPLTNNENPSVEELKDGWSQHIKRMESFSRKYNKPILFTEVGYKSTIDSGIEPWKWPERRLHNEELDRIYSAQTQANLYEALFSEVWDEPWLAGFHLWKWYPSRYSSSDKNSSGKNIDFTPQNKPAEEVMSKWFLQAKKEGRD